MAKSSFEKFRSFHKHSWHRNTKVVADRMCPSVPHEWEVRDKPLWKGL